MDNRARLIVLVLGFLSCVIPTAACASSAMVLVSSPSAPSRITSVTVSCFPSIIQPSQSSKCSVTVSGTTRNFNHSAMWSADSGRIDANGNFTAPASPITSIVKATSKQDRTKTGTATITVQPPAAVIISVTVACDPNTVIAGQTSRCSAIVKGVGNFDSRIEWNVQLPARISSSGLLTAPAVSSTTGLLVTARSAADSNKFSSAVVTVDPSDMSTQLLRWATYGAALIFLGLSPTVLFLYFRRQLPRTLQMTLKEFDNILPKDNATLVTLSSAVNKLVSATAEAKTIVNILRPGVGMEALEQIQHRQRYLEETAATLIENLSREIEHARHWNSQLQDQEKIKQCSHLIQLAEQAVASIFMRVQHFESVRAMFIAAFALVAAALALLLAK
jgi:hypothetical protein